MATTTKTATIMNLLMPGTTRLKAALDGDSEPGHLRVAVGNEQMTLGFSWSYAEARAFAEGLLAAIPEGTAAARPRAERPAKAAASRTQAAPGRKR